MKRLSCLKSITILILVCYSICPEGYAQQYDCSFKEPVVKIDFGVIGNMPELQLARLDNYNKIWGMCPDDGNYSFMPYTNDCFTGHWHTLREDHTPGDASGMMMIVNASRKAGTFFVLPVTGLKGNTRYEFSAWIVNVCRSGYECTATPPVIRITLETASGMQVATFNTGEIVQTLSPNWQRYYGMFTTPTNMAGMVIRMEDITDGGCGNDFALDDINIRECVPIKPAVPVLTEETKPVVKPFIVRAAPVPEKKPVPDPAVVPVTKRKPVITKVPEKERPVTGQTEIKAKKMDFPVPKLVAERENPVVKSIETPAAEIVIDLYDNGEIDGDTVSIYHNNQLVVARAGLSEKAISFHIKIDEQHPHHEIIMVANNLGSIPPNTSLMIVTAKDKRYEVFISSSEQKNAKVVIDLKD